MKLGLVATTAAVVLVASCTSDPPRGSAADGPTSSGVVARASISSGGGGASNPGVSSGVSTPGSSDPERTAALAAATRELQAYLDSWRSTGLANANRRYLTPDEQVSPASGAPPGTAGASAAEPVKLARGRVGSVALQSWTSSDRFVVLADLVLVFTGDATSLGNWSAGSNGRFITFTRTRTGDVPYVMGFASSP